MKKAVLVTGSSGFVGRNLVTALQCQEGIDLVTFDIEDDRTVLDKALGWVDFIFHLAGVNRPQHEDEFQTGNAGLTGEIVEALFLNPGGSE